MPRIMKWVFFGACASAVFLSVAAVPQSTSTLSTTTSSIQTASSTGEAATSSGGVFTNARLTFYNASMGACGQNNTDADPIVALNEAQWAGGANCNKTITITVNGKSNEATIKDLCGGCPFGGLDLTPTLFGFFGDLGAGHITGEWSFKDGSSESASQSGSTTGQGTTSTPPPGSTPSTSPITT